MLKRFQIQKEILVFFHNQEDIIYYIHINCLYLRKKKMWLIFLTRRKLQLSARYLYRETTDRASTSLMFTFQRNGSEAQGKTFLRCKTGKRVIKLLKRFTYFSKRQRSIYNFRSSRNVEEDKVHGWGSSLFPFHILKIFKFNFLDLFSFLQALLYSF